MQYLQNIHTHTYFCDGKDAPEDMVKEAIRLGLTTLGFSAHSASYYSNYPLPRNGTLDYLKEISRLKEVYRDQLEILLGFEYDMYCGIDTSPFDYVIGAMHYLYMNGTFIPFDRDVANLETQINEHFGGDGMAFAKRYYYELADMPKYVKADVVAHFDTITKLCEKKRFFDYECREYLDAAKEAIYALVDKVPVFEVNTGAMSRGYRTVPYPTAPVLREMCRAGAHLVLTSDCHDLRNLTYAFPETLELIRSCGFGEIYYLTGKGFKSVPLY